ncbi:MAG: toll/interleukin-1 receptor domain-containing protein [Bacteroidetes bacterium]|nr:toll/interleukin-1 receptor domain-containing protein [Bacteroidota bacterium]
MNDQFNWKSFVYNVNSRAIIPIIGNDLSFIKLSADKFEPLESSELIKTQGSMENGKLRINLYKYLSFKLWDIFSKGPLTFKPNINSVTLHLLAENISENDINLAIKNEISNLTIDEIDLEPFIQLTQIGGFDCFINVNYDNFLELAFEKTSRHINKSFNFSIPFPSIDPNERKDAAIPKIYNLMGNITGYNFAVTDEQSLEYLYLLQENTETIAKELFDTISRKNLLLIGSSFPDWFMRFFIRIISKERFKNGVKAKYVACEFTLQDPELKYFLENNATRVIPIGTNIPSDSSELHYNNSIEFIKEMHAQCTKSAEHISTGPQFKEVIFISYSWSDKLLAETFRNEMEKNGLNVFFDDDELKTGDRYNNVIKNYLKDCAYFVPLISQNAIADKNRYVYDKEWRSAIVLDGFKEQSYIRPFIIDDTAAADPRIPEEIRKLNIEKILNMDDLPKVIRKFISENTFTPIE